MVNPSSRISYQYFAIFNLVGRNDANINLPDNIYFFYFDQRLLYHRTCKPEFLCSWPSLNSGLRVCRSCDIVVLYFDLILQLDIKSNNTLWQ